MNRTEQGLKQYGDGVCFMAKQASREAVSGCGGPYTAASNISFWAGRVLCKTMCEGEWSGIRLGEKKGALRE